jgi:hypothetical protein
MPKDGAGGMASELEKELSYLNHMIFVDDVYLDKSGYNRVTRIAQEAVILL